ncbi:hypothetical protein SHKM778_90520 [Streptomyces sp. KM77-8]|uniref:Alpha/beta hydrolase n=1 Tax=Streptomyces haneummycinicus TaxID=3074435 RepID=A0AAT9HZN7_9ACTN
MLPHPAVPVRRRRPGRLHGLGADSIEAYPVTLPGLVSSHLLDGCGHWIQQERPDDVNRILVDWLAAL